MKRYKESYYVLRSRPLDCLPSRAWTSVDQWVRVDHRWGPRLGLTYPPEHDLHEIRDCTWRKSLSLTTLRSVNCCLIRLREYTQPDQAKMLGGRRENGRGGLLGRALDPVVGLGAEAIAHHRAKSKSPDSATPHTTATPSSSPYPSGEPSNAGHVSEPGLPAYRSSGLSAATADRKPASLESHGEDDADTESDEEQWTLDDAAQEVAAPHGTTGGNAATVPKGNIAAPASVDSLVHSFVKQHPPGGPNAGSALAVPVILPQRRPMDSKRGFVRAYAPLLHDCGISQETWFDFLYSFDESIKVRWSRPL